jgi:two-component system CheB/CheR fusion protein
MASAKKAPAKKTAAASRLTTAQFPIVGIGASAGGLEAFEAFFKEMPPNSGIAFVLVSHLDPGHASILPEIIQKKTKMRVWQVTDNMLVKPNQVYIIPPNKEMAILNGCLQLLELSQPRGANLPIDTFFRSLAQDQTTNAVCVILSGTGTDGTLGLRAIKGEAGMAMVQDMDSAKYDGMPRSAIATRLADYVLTPTEMPKQLLNYVQYATKIVADKVAIGDDSTTSALQKIYILLRSKTDHDFSLYKKNTICRRIERRMHVHQIDNINDYVRYLQESDRENSILFKELLIGVTNFFRDPEAFEMLTDKYLPELFKNKPDGYLLRVWVPGCSSGEEPYSIAIILQEFMENVGRHFNVQIFGTDIDEEAVNVARTGLYPEAISADVNPERLKKYFIKEESHYKIKKMIREMVVFAPQNIIKDPPFTKLDMLCCRNLLIYFGPELQKKLLPVFHYSLKEKGILFLGSSESIGQYTDLFTMHEKKWKLFTRKSNASSATPVLDFPVPQQTLKMPEKNTPPLLNKIKEFDTFQLVKTILSESDLPPSVIVDDEANILYVHGRIGRFLEPPEGETSINILEMARDGLKAGLTTALRRISTDRQETFIKNLQVKSNGGYIDVNLTVKPMPNFKTGLRGLMMVVFEEHDSSETQAKAAETPVRQLKQKKSDEVRGLEDELQFTKENLQTTIEELETSNEELKSTNEELQSTNEELQSTNEELETSKEELQSLNEESATVNAELQSRIDELSEANDDMKNLLDCTDIATLFLDTELCIRRFTPKATTIIPLAGTDSGRPIKHFASNLIGVDLTKYGNKVLDDLSAREAEVKSEDGRIFLLKIRPYRTVSNVIDGVVVTFDDITRRKQAERELQLSEERFRSIFEQTSESIVLVDAETGAFVEFNEKAHKDLGYSREEFDKFKVFEVEADGAAGEMSKHFKEVIKNEFDVSEVKQKAKTGEILNTQVSSKVVTVHDQKMIQSIWWRY